MTAVCRKIPRAISNFASRPNKENHVRLHTVLKLCLLYAKLLRRHDRDQLSTGSGITQWRTAISTPRDWTWAPLNSIDSGVHRTMEEVYMASSFWEQDMAFLGVSSSEYFCCNELLSLNKPFQPTTAWTNKAQRPVEATSSPCFIICGQCCYDNFSKWPYWGPRKTL